MAPLEIGSWHHLAVSVSSDSLLQVFINGSIQMEYQVLDYNPVSDPPFAGQLGTAIGRGAPDWYKFSKVRFISSDLL